MLHHRVIPSTRQWRSLRFASQQSTMGSVPKTHNDVGNAAASTTATVCAESVRKSRSIVSRLSERTPLGSTTGSEETHGRAEGSTRHQATSFLSRRSAQKRDHAAEKWFKGVRELDISVDQRDVANSISSPRKNPLGSSPPTRHAMRPKTDLNTLFSPSHNRSAISSRLQIKKELGGDYTSYLPEEHADPRRFPVAYARLVLGKNKHIPLDAQTGAINVIEHAIRGKVSRQVV